MKRVKRHKVKTEMPETSSQFRDQQEHDLAYYIHDRVELMHQVFSAIKPKDLLAITPQCIRHLSLDNIKELCTEELLGISSKRLCAILDGAEPPSDTESSSRSSPHDFETISLDSISSDEELLSQSSSKKSKKHKHRNRDKEKAKKRKDKTVDENTEQSKASRAGLTVLELLELQARARAIRAQLQQEQAAKKQSEKADSGHSDAESSDDDEVQLKEEPPEVVEISSDEEKPKVDELQKGLQAAKEAESTVQNTSQPQAVTKRINNLIITVPQSKPTRKIKLNRNKTPAQDPSVARPQTSTQTVVSELTVENTEVNKAKKKKDAKETVKAVDNTAVANKAKKKKDTAPQTVDKTKTIEGKTKLKKKKDKNKKKVVVGSDNDEITLQLSDSEKLDLLEDLDRKNYDSVTSSSDDSSDDDNSNESNEENNIEGVKSTELSKNINDEKRRRVNEDNNIKGAGKTKEDNNVEKQKVNKGLNVNSKSNNDSSNAKETSNKNNEQNNIKEVNNADITKNSDENIDKISEDLNLNLSNNESSNTKDLETDVTVVNTNLLETNKNEIVKDRTRQIDKSVSIESQVDKVATEEDNITQDTDSTKVGEDISAKSGEEVSRIGETSDEASISKVVEDSISMKVGVAITKSGEDSPSHSDGDSNASKLSNSTKNDATNGSAKGLINESTKETSNTQEEGDGEQKKGKEMSDGELSDRDSSEVEATDIQPEVVCISDEDKKSDGKKKKKKKKDKKSKKDKKKKSKSDFREGCDQNFYKESETEVQNVVESEQDTKIVIEDDVYEILELSDDSSSSCYEVEGAVLSKEPTAEEIEALSAKIDEINREDVVTEEEIREYERREAEKNIGDNNEEISWKERYLDSKKVKRVLSTSNIFNALRKKNKELKKKLEESKIKEAELEEEKRKLLIEKEKEKQKVDGTVEFYNTLESSTTYVDAVEEKEIEDKNTDEQKEIDETVTKEMKKDAKQLLKMYKRLLKYNDMDKKKVKDPNKKKKKKKKKNDPFSVSSVGNGV